MFNELQCSNFKLLNLYISLKWVLRSAAMLFLQLSFYLQLTFPNFYNFSSPIQVAS